MWNILGKVGSFFANAATTVTTTMSGTNFKLYFHIAIILLIIAGFAGMRIWVAVIKDNLAAANERIETLVKKNTECEEQSKLKDTAILNLKSQNELQEKQMVNLANTIEAWRGNKTQSDNNKDLIDQVLSDIEKINETKRTTCIFTPLKVSNVKPITKPVTYNETTIDPSYIIPADYAPDDEYSACPDTRKYVWLINELYGTN